MDSWNQRKVQAALRPPTPAESLKVNDIVKLGGRSQMIVTGIKFNRPANPYLGVLVNGNGAEYKFGPKHQPVKVGVADENHPALVAYRARKGQNTPSNEGDPELAQAVEAVLRAVENSDLNAAKMYVQKVRQLTDE